MQLKILPKIKSPADIRKLSEDELLQLSNEVRSFTIETITEIGGHLAPTLGVIELTVALHKVFNTPKDKIIWDVGHQGYAHKILTGRLDKFNTIRRMGGLSGFLKRSESEYDVLELDTHQPQSLQLLELQRLKNALVKIFVWFQLLAMDQ